MADGARTGGEQQRWDWLDPEIADSTKVLVALGADAIGYDSHQLQPIHADDAMGRWLGETVGSQLRRLHAKATT